MRLDCLWRHGPTTHYRFLCSQVRVEGVGCPAGRFCFQPTTVEHYSCACKPLLRDISWPFSSRDFARAAVTQAGSVRKQLCFRGMFRIVTEKVLLVALLVGKAASPRRNSQRRPGAWEQSKGRAPHSASVLVQLPEGRIHTVGKSRKNGLTSPLPGLSARGSGPRSCYRFCSPRGLL